MGQGSICKEDVTTSFLKNDEVSDGEDDTQERRTQKQNQETLFLVPVHRGEETDCDRILFCKSTQLDDNVSHRPLNLRVVIRIRLILSNCVLVPFLIMYMRCGRSVLSLTFSSVGLSCEGFKSAKILETATRRKNMKLMWKVTGLEQQLYCPLHGTYMFLYSCIWIFFVIPHLQK